MLKFVKSKGSGDKEATPPGSPSNMRRYSNNNIQNRAGSSSCEKGWELGAQNGGIADVATSRNGRESMMDIPRILSLEYRHCAAYSFKIDILTYIFSDRNSGESTSAGLGEELCHHR